MRRILLFVEDYGHEAFIKALAERYGIELGIEVKVSTRSATRGHGQVIKEWESYIRELERLRVDLPDLFIVATDANCIGYVERRREIEAIGERLREFTVYAIPDPHIERWLLLDSMAFRSVLGKGCDAPDMKCSRDRYKRLLLEAIQEAGGFASLGGMEYAEDIANAMDLKRMEAANASLGRFLKDLRRQFQQWRTG